MSDKNRPVLTDENWAVVQAAQCRRVNTLLRFYINSDNMVMFADGYF